MCLKNHHNYPQPGNLSWSFPCSVNCLLHRDLGFSDFQKHVINLKIQVLLKLTTQFRNLIACNSFKCKTTALNCLDSFKGFARWHGRLPMKAREGPLLAQPHRCPQSAPQQKPLRWSELIYCWQGRRNFEVWKPRTLQIKFTSLAYISMMVLPREILTISLPHPCGTVFISTCHLTQRSWLRAPDTQARASSCCMLLGAFLAGSSLKMLYKGGSLCRKMRCWPTTRY